VSVKYNTAKDVYRFNLGNEQREMKKWASAVYRYSNVALKVEHDWKMCYLARTPGSDTGLVEWYFNLTTDKSSTTKRLSRVDLKFETKCYTSGNVKLTLVMVKNERDVELALDADNQTHISDTSCSYSGGVYSIILGQGDSQMSALKLRADLSLGTSDVAWQHTQLFRQSLNDESSCLFDICFYFE
jgi:peptide-N4-(N-acetyl-beta-glucosaminyl)asparagine amidase